MWKKFTIGLAVLVVLFVGMVVVLEIDGSAYERFKCASVLRNQHREWVKAGSPLPPPNPTNYVWAGWGTSYIYSASLTVEGQTYQGLYAFRAYDWPHYYAITTNGVVLDLGDKKGVRLLRFRKGKAAAW